jgi:hypothetical protein
MISRLKLLILIGCVIFLPAKILSQCCGGCTPIGGNTNLGTLPKYMLQVNSFYKYGYSKGYMEHDWNSPNRLVKDANSGFVGLQLGYGIFKRLTAEVEAGYYLNRTQNFEFNEFRYTLNGYGGSSITLSARCSVLKDTAHDIELTLGAGIKMPWSREPLVVDGVELSQDVQPSNGAYGLSLRAFLFKEFDDAEMRLFLVHNTTFSSVNDKNYKDGNNYITSIFASKTFNNWTVIAQVRNEIRDYAYSDNKVVTATGGYKFYFIPQLNYSFKQKYNLSVLYEYPFYQYFYGIQLKDQYGFSVNLNIRLPISKKAEVCEKP